MRDFHLTKQEAMRTPLDQAFALSAWGQHANPYGRLVFASRGYVAQQVAHDLGRD